MKFIETVHPDGNRTYGVYTSEGRLLSRNAAGQPEESESYNLVLAQYGEETGTTGREDYLLSLNENGSPYRGES